METTKNERRETKLKGNEKVGGKLGKIARKLARISMSQMTNAGGVDSNLD